MKLKRKHPKMGKMKRKKYNYLKERRVRWFSVKIETEMKKEKMKKER
jgi:hypothetical protein